MQLQALGIFHWAKRI